MATYTNSSLVNYTRISPNKHTTRIHEEYNPTGVIDKITIHHCAGKLSVETIGSVFAPISRQASSNYGIGTDARVGLYVDEKHRAWTSGSAANDYRAVTIEVANDEIGGNWHVSDKVLAKLIDLCVDICKRNGIKKLNFTGDASGNLTLHKFFQATACPGPYLESKMKYIADQVNNRIAPMYRIRKSWTDAASQKGAYTSLASAKIECDKAGAGYHVFDANGNKVYSAKVTVATSAFKVGSEVQLVAGAKYTSGKSVPKWLVGKKLYVRSINGDNIVISTLKAGLVTGTVNKKYLKKYTVAATASANKSTSTSTTLKVGDRVRMKSGSPIYGQTTKFSIWVYALPLYVREIKGDRVVISTQKTGATTGAVHKKYLVKI